jgi:hypothetical protein
LASPLPPPTKENGTTKVIHLSLSSCSPHTH